MVDWLSRHLIAESVDLRDIFEVFRLRAWPVVEELESLLIEVLCIKAPKDVLEIKSPTPLIDQHHAGQMIICIEVFEVGEVVISKPFSLGRSKFMVAIYPRGARELCGGQMVSVCLRWCIESSAKIEICHLKVCWKAQGGGRLLCHCG